ncbi:ClpXP protease specificity-enhancing factor [Rhodoferax sp. PAMC 29310]|uniref:ClpXP protease specificity-enhancing factor n=1 Tax=Rhodoferax sp. PAMC 29310 TaxID=2822760 RepID=UPI001B32357A
MTNGETETTSTRPYLIRALHEWCTDNGLTPHLAVSVDGSVQVPQEFVREGEIVLNVSFGATSALTLGDEFIEFKGRFAGAARDIRVPVRQVMGIYARENGQGMSFPISVKRLDDSTIEPPGKIGGVSSRAVAKSAKRTTALTSVVSVLDRGGFAGPDPTASPESRGPRPTLTRIK